jgi:hypothetical protein
MRRMLSEIHLKFQIHIWMGRIDPARDNPIKPQIDGVSPFVRKKTFDQACSDV